MKDFKNDSTDTLSRFGRDKRVRTTTATMERVERSPRPQRDAADSEQPSHRGRASYNPNFTADNRPAGEERPHRAYGDRPAYGDRGRTYGNKPAYGERKNDDGNRSFADRGRTSGDKPAYGQKRSFDGPKRYGDKPSFGGSGRGYGDKPANGGRKSYDGDRSFSDRGFSDRERTSGDGGRSYGDRPSTGGSRSYGDKPAYGERKSFSDRKSGPKRYDDRPSSGGSDRGRGFGDKPAYGERRSYGDKPAYGGRKFGGKPGGFKRDDRRADKPAGDYPRYNPNKQTGEMRLNRYIAQSGICSRREADDFIQAGLVSVNGTVVTELGTKVMPTDEVKFNDSRVQGEKKVYLVLNKPKGYVTTLDDPHADKTVMELVKGACTERIYPVGRLDKNSVGLLLFTNDGDLTRQLTHPSYQKKKIYQVTLDKPLERADMETIAEGITLEDGEIYADEIAYVKDDKSEVGIEIHSGRNRIVRRIFEHLGYSVQKLDRVYYAGLTKKNLKRGAWRFLTREEVERLKSGQYE